MADVIRYPSGNQAPGPSRVQESRHARARLSHRPGPPAATSESLVRDCILGKLERMF
jgi:hypothetical protein